MRATTLVQLPPELLCHILAPLDAYDLVRTCKAPKAMVDTSEMLQYIIDLSYFQMVPVGTSEMDTPPATRRKRLRQYALHDYTGSRSHVYDVHLRSLTTNDIHPDAAQPILKAFDKDNMDREIEKSRGSLKVQILGNDISTLHSKLVANWGTVGDYLQM
ncbi:hypothetical protein DFH29DRAFT_526532 [Suillus ampliporus]|nr:hypothetical protein DFH29DRAFT_526532 [Suillus ampliporus]